MGPVPDRPSNPGFENQRSSAFIGGRILRVYPDRPLMNADERGYFDALTERLSHEHTAQCLNY